MLCFVIVLSFHAAANLFNTYYDFKSGVDCKSSSDDRGLVDGTLQPSSVLASAFGLLGLGVASASYLSYNIGFPLFYIVAPAVSLCYFYTADPFSLKRYALGDITIFLMFGPLLMAGVNLAVIGSQLDGMSTPSTVLSALDSDVLAYSVPVGLLTVAILHANNTRDIDADRKAGISTLAMYLGRVRSYYFHCMIFLVAYGSVAYFVFFGTPSTSNYGSSSPGLQQLPSKLEARTDALSISSVFPALRSCLEYTLTTPHQLIVFLNVPWALYVTRLFASGVKSGNVEAMSKLPQRIAQHNLVFCTLLVMGLSEPMFLARLLIGCLFYLGGVNNIIMWSYNIHLVRMKLSNVFGGPSVLPQYITSAAFAVAAIYQLVCSACFILGIHTLLNAQLLLIWIVPVTFTVHDMWTIEHDNVAHVMHANSSRSTKGSKKTGSKSRAYPQFADRQVAIFPTEFDNEFVHFFKNVQIIGGLVLYIQVFCD